MVGSEGTLGLITELTLKLHPIPEAISAGIVAFESFGGAVQSVIETIQMAPHGTHGICGYGNGSGV